MLKSKALQAFRKKIAINTIKQLTTVKHCYTLFTNGEGEPVTRSFGYIDTAMQATGISAGRAKENKT